MLAANAPGLTQLRMICSSFQLGSKVVKKALVSINYQNRNCRQANVSGQALCPERLMGMKPAFLLNLQDLKNVFNSPCRQKFPDLGDVTFSFTTFKSTENPSGVPPPGNRTEGRAISWSVKRTDIFRRIVQVVWAGICLKTGSMAQRSACR